MSDSGTVELSVLRPQAEMVQCTDKWAAARGGTGSGKTLSLCLWLIGRIEDYPLAAHFIVGADYEQLRRGAFQTFIGLLERIGYVDGIDYHYRESPSPMVLFLKTGARLRSLSAKLAERIRSVEFQTLVLEEPPTWINAEHVYGILNGRLRHSQRSGILYGQPREVDGVTIPAMQTQGRMSFNPPVAGSWLHTVIEKRWPAEGFKCWKMSVRENYLLPDKDEYVRGLELSLDPTRWASEIDGEWATLGGKVYRTYDQKIHGLPAPGLNFDVDPSRPLLWGLDFNVAMMCSAIAQAHEQVTVSFAGSKEMPIPGWQRVIMRMLGELVLYDAGAEDVVNAFIEKWGDVARKCGLEIFGDFSGGARSQVASAKSVVRSNWDAIKLGLSQAGIPFTNRVPKGGNPPVLDRINATNAQFRTGEGNGLMVDPERNPILVADWMQVDFAANGFDIEKNKNKKLTHMSDGAGYMIHTVRNVPKAFAFYS